MSKWFHGVVLRSSLKQLIFSCSTRTFSRSLPLYSHYETLKVNPGATLKEIKDSYLKLTKQYHPDLHPDDPKCHDRFIALQEAYKILSNPDSRRDYDRKFRNRPSPKYQRPYSYPDFTQRDEWIKQEQMRREAHFKQDFSRQDFNKFYSRPHKLSPEELERFYKHNKFIRNENFLYYLFGAVLAGVVFEALLISRKRDDDFWRTSMGGHTFYRPPASNDMYGISPMEDYRRWQLQRPRGMDDEDFNKLVRRREDRGNSYTNDWDEQKRTAEKREI